MTDKMRSIKHPCLTFPDGQVSRWAWPIPLLFVAILACRLVGLREEYPYDSLRLGLSVVFYTVVSLTTLVLIGRSFLKSGKPGLLLLECGVVLWSLSGTVGDALSHGDRNINATIFNLTILLAGMCHLGGAALSLGQRRELRARVRWLVTGVGVALGALATITWAALAGWTPVFFIQGQGGTPLRTAVLLAAITIFLLSAILLRIGPRRMVTRFLRWYCLALLLLSVGLFGIMIQTSIGGIVNWLARSAQWLGGAYLLVAAISAVRETGRWEVSLDPEVWDDRLLRLLTPYILWELSAKWRYGLAILAVAAATSLRCALLPWMGTTAPYNVAMVAFIAVTIFLGIGPALLTVVLGDIAVEAFVMGAARTDFTGENFSRMAVSMAIGFLVCWVLHAIRAAARKVQKSEAKYRDLFVNMTEEVHFWKLVRDEQGRIVTWRLVDANPPTLKTWGRESVDEIRDKTTDKIFGPGATEHYRPVVEKIMTEGVPHSFEDYFPNLDRHFRFTSVPLGEYFITTGADITAIKKAELALQEANEELAVTAEELRVQNDELITAHQGLQASEQQLRMQRERMPIGCIVYDTHYCFKQMNPAAEHIFGYTAAELAGKHANVVVPESTRPHVDDLLRRLAGGDLTAHSVNENLTKDGRIILCEWTNTPLHDANGVFIGFLSMVNDITERRRAEEEMAQLSSYPLLNPKPILDLDVSGKLLFSNPAAQKLFPDIQQRGLQHPFLADWDDVRGALARSVDAVPREIMVGDRWYHQTLHYLHDAQRIRIYGLDITESKRAEEALQRRSELLEGINRILALGLGPQTEEELCASCLDVVEKLTGSAISFIGEIGTDGLMHDIAISNPGWDACNIYDKAGAQRPPGNFQIHGIYGRVLSDGRGLIANDPASHPDSIGLPTGHPPLTSFLGVPLIREGTTVGMIAVGNRDGGYGSEEQQALEDIAPAILEALERKRAEKKLIDANVTLEGKVEERTNELAQRAAQLRALAGELTLSEQRERSRLAKILHDHLQQLLVAAKFRTTILGRGGDEVIQQGSKEVQELIDEAIGASRSLTAELSPPILHEAGLNAGLEWLAKRMADRQGLFVDLELGDIVALPEEAKVLLFESVRELLFNVVKHAHTASANVNMRRVNGHLQITVSDEGAGFDPATMKAPGEEGRGFGLFSIKERLELMGGALQAESAQGQGSRFVIRFPIGTSTTSEPKSASVVLPEAQLVTTVYPDTAHKVRVMVADDHAVVRQGIANLLMDQPDFEVVAQAADGQEAVALAAKLRPDVILMDMSMPKLNGVEATRIIHNDWPQIRIIGLSMFEETDRAKAMRDAGAVEYLTKSGPAEILIKAIRAASVQLKAAVLSGLPTRTT